MRRLSRLLHQSTIAKHSYLLLQSHPLYHIHILQRHTAAAATARTKTAAAAATQPQSSSGVGELLILPPMGAGDAAAPPALSLEDTLQAVAVPPQERNLGPRVEHIHVSATGLLSEAVTSALQLPQWFVLELIRFGAVHYCPVMPQPSPKAAPRMSAEHLARMQQLRASGIARHGKHPQLQVPRRTTADCQVEEGGYIRVHVHPKRFPAAHSVDWRAAVLADRPEYVVVDKPAGVQVPPTVDNLLESVVACTASALGLPLDALLNTHRLDVGTSGVVLLAKTPGFATYFSTALKSKPTCTIKIYRALTAAAPPLGPMVHWAVVKQRAAGEPAHTRMLLECAVPDDGDAAAAADGGGRSRGSGGEGEGQGSSSAVRCELIVQQVDQVCLTGAAAEAWGPTAYESTLQLVTGRTHQIRAQMAAVGCPLLGDQLYTALAARWQQEQQQEQEQQQPQEQQQVQQEDGPSIEGLQQQQSSGSPQHRHWGAAWSKVYQEDPSRPIGLQAARLRVRDVAGRMSRRREEEEEDGTREGEEASAAELLQLFATADEYSEWVEFAAGTPWWRAAP